MEDKDWEPEAAVGIGYIKISAWLGASRTNIPLVPLLPLKREDTTNSSPIRGRGKVGTGLSGVKDEIKCLYKYGPIDKLKVTMHATL